MTHARSHWGARRHAGFTLIEVLIAILVMSIGLLGFALLQTMSVRFTQSANYRTQATNLTYELMDQMRANRITAATYLGDYEATTEAAACVPKTGGDLTADDFRAAWQCRLGFALGEDATANVSRDGDQVKVVVAWGDERWDEAAENVKFEAETRL